VFVCVSVCLPSQHLNRSQKHLSSATPLTSKTQTRPWLLAHHPTLRTTPQASSSSGTRSQPHQSDPWIPGLWTELSIIRPCSARRDKTKDAPLPLAFLWLRGTQQQLSPARIFWINITWMRIADQAATRSATSLGDEKLSTCGPQATQCTGRAKPRLPVSTSTICCQTLRHPLPCEKCEIALARLAPIPTTARAFQSTQTSVKAVCNFPFPRPAAVARGSPRSS
jgi:hypothetical protein